MAGAPDNRDVWAIVRCYNEAPVVGQVIRGLREKFPLVVGIDDGSTDGSDRAMAAAGARVVRHSFNLGAGAALQTGIEYALLDSRADYFVCFDADGQHRVQDAFAMVERLRHEPVDVIIGSRFLGAAEGMPPVRRAVLRAARVFERATSGLALTDAHNGLRAFTRRFATHIDFTMSGMAYASEFIAIIRRSGLAYAEHPVTIEYSPYSLAKGQRSINAVNIAVDIWLNHALGRRQD